MKIIKVLLFISIIVSYPHIALTASNYEKALFDASISILKELNYMNELSGKNIAVFGFHDANTEQGCRSLSVALANQIDSNINNVKSLLNVPFRTIPRHALDSIETEYLLSKGGSDRNYSDIIPLLKSSNILITGMWQDQGIILKLTIKAIPIRDKDIDELTTVSKEIDKSTIPKNLLSCLEDYSEFKPDQSSPQVETIRGGEIDWKRKLIRVKGFGAANKTFPKNVWKKSAEEAAIVDAQVKLIELIEGLKIESKTFIKNYQVLKDEKIKEIKGNLKNVRKSGKTMYPTGATAEVVLELVVTDVF